jgi:hypothetical protein
MGDREMLPHGAEHLAGLLAARGEGTGAARLYGAVVAWREATAAPPRYPGFEPAYRRGLAAARAQLDDAAWDAAWAAGRALPLAEAIAEALATGMGADDAGPVGGKARRE